MTGAYACFPDCDDILEAEYVSAMAGWLESHPECFRVACDSSDHAWDLESTPGWKKKNTLDTDRITIIKSTQLKEHFLLRKTASVCFMMVRTDYLRKRRVMDLFLPATAYRGSQESLNVPIDAENCETAYIHRQLYRVERSGEVLRERKKSGEKARAFTMEQFAQYRIVVEQLDLCADEKKRLVCLAKLYTDIWLSRWLTQIDETEEIRALQGEMAETTNQCIEVIPPIRVEDVARAGFEVFFRAVGNRVLECENKYVRNDIRRIAGGRIIGYGVGTKAKQLVPAIAMTPLKPDVLWDIKAQEGCMEFGGFSVEYPDFDGLKSNDTVLVFVKDARCAYEIEISLRNSKAGDYLLYLDVLDYMAAYFFPHLHDYRTSNLQHCGCSD
jgi:hypothetical protein